MSLLTPTVGLVGILLLIISDPIKVIKYILYNLICQNLLEHKFAI